MCSCAQQQQRRPGSSSRDQRDRPGEQQQQQRPPPQRSPGLPGLGGLGSSGVLEELRRAAERKAAERRAQEAPPAATAAGRLQSPEVRGLAALPPWPCAPVQLRGRLLHLLPPLFCMLLSPGDKAELAWWRQQPVLWNSLAAGGKI